jgi:hypothetical protein
MEDSMLTNKINRRFHWLGAAAIGALGLAAVAVPLTSAKAQIGVEVGPVGIGIGGPYYGYYGPAPYYSYGYYGPYYHHYYYRGW